MDHNIVQYLDGATVDSEKVNSATTTMNSTSKSATANSEVLKWYNIYSATLDITTWRSATVNSRTLINCSVDSAILK